MNLQPHVVTLHIQNVKLQQLLTQAGQLMDGTDNTYLCWLRDAELARITDCYPADVLTLTPMQTVDPDSATTGEPMKQYSIRLPKHLAAFAEAVGPSRNAGIIAALEFYRQYRQ